MSAMSLWLRLLRRYPRARPWSKYGNCGCLSQLTREPDSMARTADYSKQSCSIAATLEVVGDPWTLLIVREAFSGVRRFEDRLTSKGRDLYPVMMALTAWGDKHAYAECGGGPVRMVHTACNKEIRPVITCAGCGEPVKPTEIR